MADLDYLFSAAMYCEGFFQVTGEYPSWAFLVLHKPIWRFTFAPPNESDLLLASQQFRKALRLYAQCRETGRYPGPKTSEFRLPAWKRAQIKHQLEVQT
jgi:hypothetical protein